MKSQYDVVIAGAGPVGLSLALGLARDKKSVLVLEKEAALRPHSRAPAIWPRTLEVLSGLGVVDKFLAAGQTISDVSFWDADAIPETRMLGFSLDELRGETPFPYLLILPQEKTEEILLNELMEQVTADVRFSAEALDLKQSEKSVEVTYAEDGEKKSVRARFAVGCDGAHSRVRELLGFTLDGETYPMRAALADVRLAENRDYSFPRVSTAEIPAFAIRLDVELWRLILPFAPAEDISLDERIRIAVAHLFKQQNFEVVWQSEFKLHRRVSTEFGKGRVVLAGDAAHINSPVGGQGMNSGIQDTEGLDKALQRALFEDSPEALHDYAQARRAQIKLGVNKFTDRLTRVIAVRNGEYFKSAIRAAGWLLRLKYLRHRFLRRVAMLNS